MEKINTILDIKTSRQS